MSDGSEVMRQFVPSSPFVGHLGMQLVRCGDGEAEIALPFAQHNITIGEMVHGGAIASLIDTTAMAAAWASGEAPENMRGTTVSITVQYLAAASSTDLLARARTIKRGKNLAYVDVDVFDAKDHAVAKGLVTYKLG